MNSTGKPAGPVGLSLLAVTAVAGIIMAVHGWSGRHTTAGAAALAGSGTQAPAVKPGRSAGPSAGPAPSASGASPAASPGPLLSSQSYAQYSFRVWPGTPSAAARAALTGLSVKVSRQGSGIVVTAGVLGQPSNPPHSYPRGAAVYVIEATLGDDSGNSDYSLGDDGLVVTDAQGRILQ